MRNEFNLGEIVYCKDDVYDLGPLQIISIVQSDDGEMPVYDVVDLTGSNMSFYEQDLSREQTSFDSAHELNTVEVYNYDRFCWEGVDITQDNQHLLNGCVIDSYDIDDDGYVRLRISEVRHELIRNKEELYRSGDDE